MRSIVGIYGKSPCAFRGKGNPESREGWLSHDLPDALGHGALRTTLMALLRASCDVEVGLHPFTALIQL